MKLHFFLLLQLSTSKTLEFKLENCFQVINKNIVKFKSIENIESFSLKTTFQDLNFQDQDSFNPQSIQILPDPKDKNTVLSLLKMSNNVYLEPNQRKKWIPIEGWNDTTQFGWERGIYT